MMSSIIMTVVLPIRAARLNDPRRALRRAVTWVLLFNICYWAVVLTLFNLLPAKFAPAPP